MTCSREYDVMRGNYITFRMMTVKDEFPEVKYDLAEEKDDKKGEKMR